MTEYVTWLADVLRDAGIEVVEHSGWKERGHGGFTELTHVVWHHDASPPGDSPGVCRYMLNNWDKHGAQVWIGRQGVWHLLAAGVAFHAGRTLPGKPGNKTSLGIETDHTNGEDWPAPLLNSLRRGTAAVLRHLSKPAAHLEFHKTICSPVGRKSDPDGLSLLMERLAVADLILDPPVIPEEFNIVDKTTKAYFDAAFRRLEGGPRTPDRNDTNPQAISLADLLTAVERIEKRLIALEEK